MEKRRERLIHLVHCRGAGWRTIEKIYVSDPSLESVFSLSPAEIADRLNIPFHDASRLYSDLHEKPVETFIREYEQERISLITIFDEQYPPLLKQIHQPPWVLFARGNPNLLQNPRTIAVVGTRTPTRYGLLAADLIVEGLVEKDFLIVSGFARGIDIRAQRRALEGGGNTVAVLGSGFYHIYPKESAPLLRSYPGQLLLLSEYPPDTPPKKHQFPQRNRIISGLSLGTVVVEARERSGSLITAQFALDYGREVFAVPGPVTSPVSAGTNRLIQEGAKLVQRAEDILEELFLFRA